MDEKEVHKKPRTLPLEAGENKAAKSGKEEKVDVSEIQTPYVSITGRKRCRGDGLGGKVRGEEQERSRTAQADTGEGVAGGESGDEGGAEFTSSTAA